MDTNDTNNNGQSRHDPASGEPTQQKVAYAWVPAPEGWQYRISYLAGSKSTLEDRLNELGREGWEIVSMVDSTIVLKRKLVPIPVSADEMEAMKGATEETKGQAGGIVT